MTIRTVIARSRPATFSNGAYLGCSASALPHFATAGRSTRRPSTAPPCSDGTRRSSSGRLFDRAVGETPHEVERVSGKATARSHADVQPEVPAQRKDRARVSRGRAPRRCAGSSASASSLGLDVIAPRRPSLCSARQVDRSLRERVPVPSPAAPADLRVDVGRVEPRRLEHTHGRRHDDRADAVALHHDDAYASVRLRFQERVQVLRPRSDPARRAGSQAELDRDRSRR